MVTVGEEGVVEGAGATGGVEGLVEEVLEGVVERLVSSTIALANTEASGVEGMEEARSVLGGVAMG